jgi:tRNA uridine 5-carboxymethylaminomethyl modification enzyme
VRFADKSSHQIFVEPEGLTTSEVYPNGISTSLPFDVQLEIVHSIAGFERAHITRPGYAIEYDYFDPRDLQPNLATRHFQGLWFAGQINGTTGYEEAAAQGLVAGINAARCVHEQEAWCPRRDEAYIGVLIDDLVTRGTSEPYRMFTSRAEHRLLLREDNADLRLTPAGRELGLVDDERWARFEQRSAAIDAECMRLQQIVLKPDAMTDEETLRVLGQPLAREQRAFEALKRPEVSYAGLASLAMVGSPVADASVAAQVEIQAKYAGYIARQHDEIDRARRHEDTRIPQDLDYAAVRGLSNEVRQKLAAVRPHTLGQAGRISGVTPAALSLLLVHLKRRDLTRLRVGSGE